MNEAHQAYHIHLDVFEGPLDLLLHLIKENQIDVYDIPVAHITEQYLVYLDLMKTLNLDIASEYLLMAATLTHIKSQMLLPTCASQQDLDEEGQDPRMALVKRLLEYQKYKNAADHLISFPLLYRDVFVREGHQKQKIETQTPTELVEISIFRLVEAFHRALANVRLDEPQQIELETVTLGQCVTNILKIIRASSEGMVRFQDLFHDHRTRQYVIMTFLALLDMVKRGAVRVFQTDTFTDIALL